MKIILAMSVLLIVSGCSSISADLTKNELNIQNKMLLAEQISKLDEKTQREERLKNLQNRFLTMEIDLQRAINYAVKLQTKDFEKRRNIGTIGAFMGLVATTLNVASKANIVTSTAFTGMQTLALNHVTNSDLQIVNPNSYEQMQKIREDLEKLYVKYDENFKVLLDPKMNQSEWDIVYRETDSILTQMKIKMASVLSPKDYTEKSNRLNGEAD
ncbi:hypothetical protein A7P54_03885 [Acinetobacter sp. Ac_3412]|uniref:hypothetical protein n=1 Tax=Acinetobacter sp. Ac_3412 TaxID=1848935 RepID=UPI00148F9DD2|nr:hypothetical protein [Acinetobacter sp. Ac_3412]NNP75560.1 hypothetical protein [Acinetobacter sp. Ac_3412]